MQETLASEIDCKENRDITLGMIIERIDQLIESNTNEHKIITERLTENEKNVVILNSLGAYFRGLIITAPSNGQQLRVLWQLSIFL